MQKLWTQNKVVIKERQEERKMGKALEEMSLNELKVLHFDEIRKLSQLQSNIQIIESLIDTKEKKAMVK